MHRVNGVCIGTAAHRRKQVRQGRDVLTRGRARTVEFDHCRKVVRAECWPK